MPPGAARGAPARPWRPSRRPAFLAHVATVLQPHLHEKATREACRRLLAAVDAEVPAVFATLPAFPATPPMPPAREFADVLAALGTYRKTSPEMVVVGRMLGDALPAQAAGARGPLTPRRRAEARGRGDS